jgi:MarR family
MLAKQLWPSEQSAHLLSPGAERHGPLLIPPLIERWYEFAYTRIMREQAKKVAPDCLGFRARLLSRVITATYDDALAKVGLKVSQFSVLNAVASRDDTRPAELANFLAMDESTLSRNVARMCARVGSDWNMAKMIGVAIKSQSRTWVRLYYERAIPPGNKRKTK